MGIQVESRLWEVEHVVIEHGRGEDSHHNVGVFKDLVGVGEILDFFPVVFGLV